jgi:hypothetical protein
VLLPLAVAAVLFPLGFVAVARVAGAAMTRLGLEPWTVLLWFGLAEAPVDDLVAKRAAPVRPRRGSGANTPSASALHGSSGM